MLIWIGYALAALLGLVALFVAWAYVDERKLAARYGQLPEREQLLCFGALMQIAKDRPARFPKPCTDKRRREALMEEHNVVGPRSARQLLHSLMSCGDRTIHDADFALLRLQTGHPPLKTLESRAWQGWSQARAHWLEEGLPADALAVSTLAAYDFERIAWTARECWELGLLQDDEFWRALIWVAVQARQRFSDWSDYAASFILGRAALSEVDDNELYGRTAKKLMGGDDALLDVPCLWKQYPLLQIRPISALPAQVALTQEWPDADASLSIAPRAGLLGFGALIAAGFGQIYSTLGLGGTSPSDLQTQQYFLARHMGIRDPVSALRCIDEILGVGARAQLDPLMDPQLHEAACVSASEFQAAASLEVRRLRQSLWYVGVDEPTVNACRTAFAYDLERAAYLTRAAFAVGYLHESVAWIKLRRIAWLSRAAFTTWEQYFISCILGMALPQTALGQSETLVAVGAGMLKQPGAFAQFPSIWKECPLSGVGFPEGVNTK